MVETIADGDVATYADFDNRYLRHDDRFGVERTSLTALPVIDISAFRDDSDEAARAKVARELRRACISIGFFYLRGHGFASSEFDELLSWGRRFFALPPEGKAKIHWNQRPGQGYIPPGGVNAGKTPDKNADQKSRLYLGREYALDESEAARYPSTSQWPDEAALPGFRRFVMGYTRKSVALAQRLGRAFARSLDLPEMYFVDYHDRFGGTLAYNHYESLDRATLERTQWSFSPHTDYGMFTVLLQDQLGGLQVRNATGQWIDVVPIPGTLVVNVGDMMAMVTNDLYTSNLHRVINFSGQERLSVSFFVSPPPTTTLRCLESCQGPDNPPRHDPIAAGEYHRILIEQYHRTGRPGIAVRTADRMRPR